MKEYIVKVNQTLQDVALQQYGSATAIHQLVADNEVDYYDQLAVNQVLLIDETKILNREIVDYYKQNNILIATGQTLEQQQVLQALVTNIQPDRGRQDGKVFVTVFGGSKPYSYIWSNGAKTKNLTNVASGEYILSVTDADGTDLEVFATVPFIDLNIYLQDETQHFIVDELGDRIITPLE